MYDFRTEREQLNKSCNNNIAKMQSNIDKVIALGLDFNINVEPLVDKLQTELINYKNLINTAMGNIFVTEILQYHNEIARGVYKAQVFAKQATYHYLRDSVAILKLIDDSE